MADHDVASAGNDMEHRLDHVVDGEGYVADGEGYVADGGRYVADASQ